MRDTLELYAGQEVTAPAAPLAGRRFLLVTQPVGPFSRRLAASLRQMGAKALRVVLNGGDILDWGPFNAVLARGRFEEWPAFIARTIEARAITDVVVFGDATCYCAGALAAARAAGVHCWVMENGYQRPNWVTLEAGGVNANSSLPRYPEAYDDVDLASLGEGPATVGQITPFHTAHMMAYFTAVILAWPLFRQYRYPYTLKIWPQAWGHLRRYLIWLVRRRARETEAARILEDPRPFFLACLQREGDTQLLRHSDVKTNRAFMARVIRSFAAHAPSDARLVIKNHPLDPGVDDLPGACKALAWSHGLAGRVKFLEGGAFAPLAHVAAGVVTVNSTAALAAMEFGAPVKLLGRAIFDIEGLTDCQALDDFWNAPKPPDAGLLARFRRRLSLRTQVWGSYHNPHVLTRTAHGIAARLACPQAEFLA